MSYSYKVKLQPGADIHHAEVEESSGVEDLETQEVLNTAHKAVVQHILDAGIVGDSSKSYLITVSGHTNPGHEPRAGWSNDTVTITVAQV
jgi:hypothetical protein